MKLRQFVIASGFYLVASTVFAGGEPGKFDYYVMSLSWSPDYCAFLETKKRTDPNQCLVGKKLGFVLHGVWPQYVKGYPSDCTTEKLTSKDADKFPNLYPSNNLPFHEWEKHGTCSGLTPDKYLDFSKTLKDNFKIPVNYIEPEKPFRTTIEKLQQDVIATNPGLAVNGLTPFCSGSGRFLQELRVCYSKEGKFTECSTDVLNAAKKSCAQPDFLVRNVK